MPAHRGLVPQSAEECFDFPLVPFDDISISLRNSVVPGFCDSSKKLNNQDF
jgi:hypothetical protein